MSKNTIESSERTEILIKRNDDGKIEKYLFKIYKRDRDPFIGELSREDMEFIMHNYVNRGAGLTQKEIARNFAQYTFNQIKDIIRAFNITKADLPLAPHEVEEYTEEEALEVLSRIKEHTLTVKAEATEVRDLQNGYNRLASENIKLKKQLDELNNIASSINVSDLPIKLFRPVDEDGHFETSTSTPVDICIWLSDMHIGAWVNAEESLFGLPYDEEVVHNRLNKITEKLISLSETLNIRTITICNLGDSLDGMDQQTARRDHILPQNMSNNQQLETFVKCMTTFFVNLKNNIECDRIQYYCVGDSNHDGIFGRAANRILQLTLEPLGIKSVIFTRFMDFFTLGDLSVILCHGKDSKDMKKPLPIVINPQTEIKISQFISTYKVPGSKILFVKGDSHTSALTYGSGFIYKSVGAFIGATKWSSANFGITIPVCDYSIIDRNCNILDGQIDLR